MWIVRLALSRPRMVAVIGILILLLGVLNITRMAKDIFPPINLPVISVIWSYGGLAPQETERRIIRVSEIAITNNIASIQHVESQSLTGVGVIKVFFQPGTQVSEAVAQITAAMQSVLRGLPQGATPPIILPYDASDVPIVQLALNSNTRPINQVMDAASNTVIPQLITVPGATIGSAAGGPNRQIMVDLDPQAMTAHGVTAQELTTAIGSQNLILPAGDAKIGTRDYFVRLNNSPTAVDTFNNLPIKMVNGATIYVRDVAHVRDGSGIPQSIIRVDGKPAVLITILKNGSASTLDVVNAVKAKLPALQALLPPDIKLNLLLDQSIFVRSAVTGVVREAVVAACLTGLMILLFLGSWRSTLVVAISIPLSILASIVLLGVVGQTINTLTLGGLALAVGMLVDDATVEVENTTRNLGEGMPLREGILHSAQQVALPALTSTLSICIVFVPVAFLSGVSQSLFLPLAMAVIFAMLPSYFLSRTLVPNMMLHLLDRELDLYQPTAAGSVEEAPSKRNIVWRIHEHFERHFDAVRDAYHRLFERALHHRVITVGILLVFFTGSAVLLPSIGQDFFPNVDSGQMRLHVRVPPGTRLETTGRIYSRIDNSIRKVIPPQEMALILDNIGLPGGISYVRGNSGTIGPADGEIDVSLTANHHSTWDYMAKLRQVLQKEYPECTFYFQPADISTQVLDFGTSAPIDIQVLGPYQNQEKNYALAQQIQKQVALVSGVVDTYIYQVHNAPEMRLNVDRTQAMQVGLTQQNVAGNILVSLSSSSLVSPSYYLDPKNGVQYIVTVQTPQYKVNSVASLLSTPVSSTDISGSHATPQLLSNMATVGRDTTPMVVSHYNTLPVFDVFASVQGRDLGGTAGDIQPILTAIRKQAPRGTTITMNGQVQTMKTSFMQLGFGLIFAIVLIYLLLTVTFESWVDPLVIVMASPGALCGVLWGLFVTQSTFNVPSLMGTIMSIGVATANSILLVTFANEQREEGKNAIEAALAAASTRFRPVIMTALAMIVGMLPMALGLGDGGEQNAPLGRAVIGGLLVATCTTLFFVPIMYTVLRRKQPAPAGRSEDNKTSPAADNGPSSNPQPAKE
ncbi:MAG: Cation/multidrug efflux pump [Chthonomonadaceae bacterium]|nr:Cation/multidrug efflux pump [Chthonomonadaceae bacterium]